MASNKGLGKGLGALLGDFSEEPLEQSAYRELPIYKVEPNPDQPRREFDEEEVVVKQCLKLVVKGEKVYKGLSDIIFSINNEIKNNNIDNKYSDIKYNKYIENFCNLIERNNVDI